MPVNLCLLLRISSFYVRLVDRFLFRFTGKDDEINLNGDGSEKPEFGEWTWMTPQQVIEKVG
jgi:hypothetical protein